MVVGICQENKSKETWLTPNMYKKLDMNLGANPNVATVAEVTTIVQKIT